ncbi:PLP-dependent aminotransferase family protein [Rhizobium lentis]|uniref:MocR-like pyridoxine biosynthesis transcription factor PdxR n=1 Tax=Rhizobium lentis TaxID=1138194 RepID=UPI001C828FA5|nr:PLP-dependent aminotransferase family protein [Rhizobium lentis]MBX4999006.1 PLP-dependent aminotransferase family protein [Rhizobium lentis]MBX5017917.1 PLP-dependent aminotransferase family protein [Rhizobium lentis]MBX5042640.1 PLP-dependent aminotransferase family protein [Rhizobium lentis]MBX5048746.1 PLP-dependent aminotransferase family protein [Rhizobium lentis]MBX5051166.1 PLP-dependent aminotransferase family protein [Rhizobium lentis]
MTPAPAWLDLDRDAGDLAGQIYRGLRDRILLGQLPAGYKLPSTRAFAASLGVARSTAVEAYDRLKSEGYIEASAGAATRIAALARMQQQRPMDDPWPIAETPSDKPPDHALFRPGVPDVSAFPHAVWSRYLAARSRSLRIQHLGYENATGIFELRKAILDHISTTRGVVAVPEQVLVVPSTRAAIDILARTMLRRSGRKSAWMENPGYPAARALLGDAGAEIVPVPCDEQGIDVSRAEGPRPALIYVTPSHQYPTGATMTLPRRLALLEAARRDGSLIVEDDYDSDFHYGSRQIAALQGIDRAEVVAYLGTFSKVLAPGLRVAYAVVPRWLVAEASQALQLRGVAVPTHVQAALADFISEGRLRAHLRRMNPHYADRMVRTVEMLTGQFADRLALSGGYGGLQLATWFRDEAMNDRAIIAEVNRSGYGLMPMSDFFIGKSAAGILFGISRAEPAAVQKLAADLEKAFGLT